MKNLILFLLISFCISTYAKAQKNQKLRLDPPLKNFADPDVIFENNMVYLSGTFNSKILPLYSSKNGVDFKRIKNINPSALDKKFNYCKVWAPDLVRFQNGVVLMTFSASRYKKNGGKCGDTEVTTYTMKAQNLNFNFSTPQLKYTKYGPKSSVAYGCAHGCSRTIRIDADNFIDPDTNKRHFFYTSFDRGNDIYSFPENKPTDVIFHRSADQRYEENITEAPDVFKRGKYYYMLYSVGSYNTSYGLDYIYAKSIKELNGRDSAIHRLYMPRFDSQVRRCSGFTGTRITEAGGHSSTVKIKDAYFVYYHKNRFKNSNLSCHEFAGRDIYRTKITFKMNGEIIPFDHASVHWNNLGKSYLYSLDIKLKNGTTIAPCLPTGVLGKKRHTMLNGNCRDRKYDPRNVDKVRICAAPNEDWSKGVCSPYKKAYLSKFLHLRLTKKK